MLDGHESATAMSAEPIARVIIDLRAGRIRRPGTEDEKLFRFALDVATGDGPVVDATAIYDSLVARDDPIAIYEDHPCIAPPWPSATICYRNEHGNVIAMSSVAEDGRKAQARWEPAEPVEWERVRWTINTFVWIGGRGGNGPFPVTGPMHLWQFAVYEDGTPADLHWVHLVSSYPMEHWDMAHLVLLGALNFCNCRNVELVEPKRPRAEAKRIARTGVRVSTINVFPAGRSTRSAKVEDSQGTPLTSVRGHFATYGPEYGRGLLFGKYAGRFWIPQHARGSTDVGQVQSDYVLHTS